MLKRYNVKSARSLFDPDSREPFRVSRSKIELFLECERCFYLDQRLGIARPSFPPFSLNNAVDELLKKEFDIHRAAKTPHPMMEKYGIDAVPFADSRMEEWRDALKRGVQYLHEPTNLILRGGVDDIWVNPQDELIVVDYKATSKKEEVNLDAEWQISYKRQMEVYQWLLRRNGFTVSPTGYFFYVNGKTDRKAFDGKLEFDVTVIPYKGSDEWIEKTVLAIRQCLCADTVPEPNEDCEYCGYRREAGKILQQKYQEQKQAEQKKHSGKSDATLF